VIRKILSRQIEDEEFENVTSIRILEADRIRGSIEPLQVTINMDSGRKNIFVRRVSIKNLPIEELTETAGFTEIQFKEKVSLFFNGQSRSLIGEGNRNNSN